MSALHRAVDTIACFIKRVKQECKLQVHVEIHVMYDLNKTIFLVKMPLGCRPKHLKCIQDILEHHLIQLKSIEADADRNLVLYGVVK